VEDLRHEALAVAVLTLAAALLLASPASAQATEGPAEPTADDVTYEWWNDRWHMRVPVLVRPQMPDAVVPDRRPVLEDAKDVPVHAEIDFTDVVRQAGDSPEKRWPKDVGGALDSFTFDKDSVRVLRYDRDSGQVQPHPRTGDLVPHQFVPTLLEGRDLSNDRFDPSANAVGTVSWVAEGTLDESRLYFVYFDIEQNGDKPEPSFTPEEKGALDGLHWLRPGTDAYGYVPADDSSAGDARPVLEVHGLYKNTAVQVKRYPRSGSSPIPLESCEESDAGLCVRGGEALDGLEEPTFEIQPLSVTSPGESVRVESPQSVGYKFHVEADKPVLVSVHPREQQSICPTQLFYPGSQGLVSTSFTFENLMEDPPSNAIGCDDHQLRLVAPEEPASVTWEWVDTGETRQFAVEERSSVKVDLGDGARGRDVRVTTDQNPIAVVQPGAGNIHTQAPTPHGAPVGSSTLAPADRSIRTVPWTSPATVNALDLEETTNEDAQASATGGPGPAQAAIFDDIGKDFRGDVWSATAGGQPITSYHGESGLLVAGGRQAQEFQIPVNGPRGGIVAEDGRMILFPAYDRTDILVHDNATGTEAFNGSASRHVYLDQQAGEDLFPSGTGYHVEADKPIMAYAVSEARYSTYYPSVSRSPLYDVGEASFHGRLVRWDQPLRQETMAPGQEKRFGLEVSNLGREIGGDDLPDDIVVEQETRGNGSVQLSTQQVSDLGTFDSRQIQIAVSIPDEAKTGDTFQVNLTAISQGNPEFQAETELKITVRTLFRVELSFRDADCNPKSCERLVEGGSSTLYSVNVNNTGTGDDAYTFSFSESQAGFEGEVLRPDGTVLATADEARETLSVPRGEERLVFFNVSAPEDAVATFPYTTQVQALSESDSSAKDGVTATTVLSVNTDYRLEVLDDVRSINPGENTTFPVRVVNEGDDTVLDVGTSEPSLDGWNVSVDPESFLLRANGTTAPDGTRGDVRVVDATVTASEDARVGQILPLEVQVRSETSQGTAGEETAEVRAVVANNFTFVTSGLQPRSLKPGETFRYEFTARNAANGPFTATVNATGLPDGWRFEKDEPVAPQGLDVGDTLQVSGDLVLPAGTPAGPYNVTFSLFGEAEDGDRGVTNVTGRIQVARRANLEISAPAPVTPVPPGNVTAVPLNVTNAGNVDLTADLSLTAPTDWSLAFQNRSQERLPLESGESETVPVTLGAPADIGSGPVDWSVEADLPLRNPQTFGFQADWIRRDLSIEDQQVVTEGFEPGTVSVLAVTVRNEGDLPANNVELAVLVDGEVASNTTVQTMPPGQDRVVRIEWTVPSSAGNLEVAVDPTDAFVETNEDNNRRSFSPTSQGAIPAIHPLVAALAAAGLALARRRWSR
jgi:uncharacterized membrane protein